MAREQLHRHTRRGFARLAGGALAATAVTLVGAGSALADHEEVELEGVVLSASGTRSAATLVIRTSRGDVTVLTNGATELDGDIRLIGDVSGLKGLVVKVEGEWRVVAGARVIVARELELEDDHDFEHDDDDHHDDDHDDDDDEDDENDDD